MNWFIQVYSLSTDEFLGEIRNVRTGLYEAVVNMNGSFALDVDATQANKELLESSLFSGRRRVAFYAYLGDTWIHVGGGVVMLDAPIVFDDVIRVSGDGMLTEWQWKRIVNGAIFDSVFKTSSTERGLEYHYPDGGSFTSDYPMDNLPFTFVWASDGFLYVGHYAPFDQLRFIGSQYNSVVTTLVGNYWRLTEAGQVDEEPLTITDGTALSGAPMAQNGIISWTPPDDWIPIEHGGRERFWMRLRPQVTLDEIIVTLFQQRFRGASQNDVQQVMFNYAPNANWDLHDTSRQATVGGSFWHRIHYVSPLKLYRKMAEQSGEFFRWQPQSNNWRRLKWLVRGDETNSQKAIASGKRTAVAANPKTCWIDDIQPKNDYGSVATRLYVEGAGQGVAALTLELSTDTYTGFNINRTEGYVETALPVDIIEDAHKFSEIRSESGQPTEAAANQLLAAAVNLLKRRLNGVQSLDVTLSGLSDVIRPGDEMAIEYHGYAKDGQWVSVNDTFLVTQVRWNFGAEVSADVTLQDNWIGLSRDAELRLIDETQDLMMNTQPMDSSDIQRLGRTA